jgi:hypothetical protein
MWVHDTINWPIGDASDSCGIERDESLRGLKRENIHRNA